MDDQRRPGRHDGRRDRGVPEGSELLDAFCVAIGLEDDAVVGEVNGDSVTFQMKGRPKGHPSSNLGSGTTPVSSQWLPVA